MNKNNNWYYSIWFIVLMLIFFWPVGCVLLYLRWNKAKGKYCAINNTLLVSAIVLFLIGACGMTSYADTKEAEDLWLALIVFIIPGAICTFFWFKRKKDFKKYKMYLDYVSSRRKVKIDSMCNKLGVDYDTATNNLTYMINKGIINGYLADEELILSNKDGNSDSQELPTPTLKKETKVVKCKECGAKNTITVGEKNECEYCGSLLE